MYDKKTTQQPHMKARFALPGTQS